MSSLLTEQSMPSFSMLGFDIRFLLPRKRSFPVFFLNQLNTVSLCLSLDSNPSNKYMYKNQIISLPNCFMMMMMVDKIHCNDNFNTPKTQKKKKKGHTQKQKEKKKEK